jgi:hypothetical protein
VGYVVGETGFEPATSASRRMRSKSRPCPGASQHVRIVYPPQVLRQFPCPPLSQRVSGWMLQVGPILAPMAERVPGRCGPPSSAEVRLQEFPDSPQIALSPQADPRTGERCSGTLRAHPCPSSTPSALMQGVRVRLGERPAVQSPFADRPPPISHGAAEDEARVAQRHNDTQQVGAYRETRSYDLLIWLVGNCSVTSQHAPRRTHSMASMGGQSHGRQASPDRWTRIGRCLIFFRVPQPRAAGRGRRPCTWPG